MPWTADELAICNLSDADLARHYLATRDLARSSTGADQTRAGNRVKLIEEVAAAQQRTPILVAAVQEEKAGKRRFKCSTCGYPAATRDGCAWCQHEARRQKVG